MKLINYLRNFSIAPIQLTLFEKCSVALACLTAIFLTATVTQAYTDGHSSVLIASMGASAVILLATPDSPLAQPRPFIGGQMLSALMGVCAVHLMPNVIYAATLAVGLSALSMLLLRCLHPPGAATALAPVLSSIDSPMPGFDLLLAPVGINVLLMLLIALIINRLILHRDYPVKTKTSRASNFENTLKGSLADVSQADIEQATQGFHQFLDISTDDLRQILIRLKLLSVKNNVGLISCGDIMQRDIISVEYATEVETAWHLMHEHQLKVLPVLDRSRHVIVIVTRYDFLKYLKLTPCPKFQDKWLAFIKRSSETTTHKPEAIGHIMTRKVKTLPANTHIAELVPQVVTEGHHHVPIVDEAGHFVGIVFQSCLLSALFNNRVTLHVNETLQD